MGSEPPRPPGDGAAGHPGLGRFPGVQASLTKWEARPLILGEGGLRGQQGEGDPRPRPAPASCSPWAQQATPAAPCQAARFRSLQVKAIQLEGKSR